MPLRLLLIAHVLNERRQISTMTNTDERVIAVTVNEACVALSLGRNSIYNFIAEGRLTAIKLGRATRITTASIRALVETSSCLDAKKVGGRLTR
jgi:excisionase family DNA binding protein